MAKPPEAPPSSDIEGVNRDAHKSRAYGKPAEPEQQESLKKSGEETVARPDYHDVPGGEDNGQ